MSDFGIRLRKLRRDADVTQKQLSEVLNVTQTAVGKYEKQHNAYPSIDGLIKIADYFQVSIDYLLRGKEFISPKENNVSGTLTNSTVLQANHGGSVFTGEQPTSFEAMELLRIYNKFDVRNRLKLLNFAVDLDEKSKVND